MKCSFKGKRKSGTVKSEVPELKGKTPSYKRAYNNLSLMNSVAETPLTPAQLELAVRESAYKMELAGLVAVKPRQGVNRSLAASRQLRRMLGNRDWSKVDVYFREAAQRGKNYLGTLPLIADTLGVTAARLNYSKQSRAVRDEVYRLLRNAGVKKRADLEEIFVSLVEVGDLSRVDLDGLGPNARRIRENEHRDLARHLQGLGVDKYTFTRINEIVSRYVANNSEALFVSRTMGADIDTIKGIGYFNRRLTPDARRRLTEDSVKDLEALLGVKRPEGNTIKNSRSTYDYSVEDEALLADALGYFKGEDMTYAKVQSYRDNTFKLIDELEKVDGSIKELDDTLAEELPKRAERVREVRGIHAEAIDKVSREIADKLEEDLSFLSSQTQWSDDYRNKRIEVAKRRAEERLGIETRKLDKQLKEHTDAYENYQALKKKERAGLVKQKEGINAEIGKLAKEYTKASDEAFGKLNAVLDDENRLLNEVAKLTEDQLDRLVDNGVLSKMPMTSKRMSEYVINKYELPYSNLGELIIADPVKAHHMYVDQLSGELAKSNVAVGMVRGAMEHGWGVPYATFQANPAKYKGYVSLDEVLKKGGYDVRKLNLEGASGMYVPQEVAHGFMAHVAVPSSPQHMAFFDGLIKGLNRVTKAAALSQFATLARNVYSATLASFAAGTNMLHFPSSLGDVAAIMFGNYDALDNVKKVYAGNTMTLRELVLEAKRSGRIGMGSIAGESATGNLQKLTELPETLKRRAKYLVDGMVRMNPGEVLRQAGAGVEDVVLGAAAFALVPALIIEDAMKIALLKTRLGGGAMNRFTQSIFAGDLSVSTTMDDALRHMDRYFVNFDDKGALDKALGNNVAPFWMWTSRNIPMQVQNAMRHPGRYAAYLRVHAMANDEAEQRGEDLPEAGLAQYLYDGSPLLFADPTDSNKWWALSPGTFDPFLEVWNLLTKEFVPQTTQERVEEALPDERESPSGFDWIVSQLQPLLKSAFAVATNRDSFTGRKLRDEDALVGVGIEPALGLSGGQIRYILESNLPYVRAINRMNPAEIFGVSEQRDEYGRVIRQARRSLFGAQRFDSDPQVAGEDHEIPTLVRLARIGGLSITENNVALNVQRADKFYKTSAEKFKRKAGEALNDYRSETDPLEREKLMQRHLLYMAYSIETAEQQERTQLWLEARGIPLGEQVEDELLIDNAVENGVDIFGKDDVIDELLP